MLEPTGLLSMSLVVTLTMAEAFIIHMSSSSLRLKLPLSMDIFDSYNRSGKSLDFPRIESLTKQVIVKSGASIECTKAHACQ